MNVPSLYSHQFRLSPPPLLLTRRPFGAVFLAIGLLLLALLFAGSAGHRARLAVEILASGTSAIGTVFFMWKSHPAAPLVTRIYGQLSRQLRHLLLLAILTIYTFAVASAAAELTALHVRAIFALGGIVTADWVLCLAIIASIGAALCALGVFVCVARPLQTVHVSTNAIVRLWAASNQRHSTSVDACFGITPSSQELRRLWLALLSDGNHTQALLIRCARSSNAWHSEWHIVRQRSSAERPECIHVHLSCQEDANGNISGGAITLLAEAH